MQRRSEALHYYTEFEAFIQQELGTTPTPETQRLYERLLADEPLP
jgi:DNA-binding SARP family transcriptional activator